MEISGKAPADNTATDSHSVSLAKKKIEAMEVLGACGANGKRRQRWRGRADDGNIHGGVGDGDGGGDGGDAHTDQLTKPAKI